MRWHGTFFSTVTYFPSFQINSNMNYLLLASSFTAAFPTATSKRRNGSSLGNFTSLRCVCVPRKCKSGIKRFHAWRNKNHNEIKITFCLGKSLPLQASQEYAPRMEALHAETHLLAIHENALNIKRESITFWGFLASVLSSFMFEMNARWISRLRPIGNQSSRDFYVVDMKI